MKQISILPDGVRVYDFQKCPFFGRKQAFICIYSMLYEFVYFNTFFWIAIVRIAVLEHIRLNLFSLPAPLTVLDLIVCSIYLAIQFITDT